MALHGILIFGAGRSASCTINYLLEKAAQNSLSLTVADADLRNLSAFGDNHTNATFIKADIHDDAQRQELIKNHEVVISLLPAAFHIIVAKDCLAFGKHLVTPSYISPEIALLGKEVSAKNLVFLNEMGLDPGIDHMSAMHIINRLKEEGAEILSFKSYTGGLVATESDTNPWHYKISWNPYNVARAGQDGAICMVNSEMAYVSYERLFKETEIINIENSDSFDAYLNRDSLRYIALYGLENTGTFIRGTLRYPGFCKLWNALVAMGVTSDRLIIENLNKMSLRDFFRMFLSKSEAPFDSKIKALTSQEWTDKEIRALEWLGVYSTETISLERGTPVQVLQQVIEQKWKMEEADKDRVVMLHEFIYKIAHQKFRLRSVMDINGEDGKRTAMAKTVGMPLALAAELILHGKINTYGVILPTLKGVYEPLLSVLGAFGIGFTEHLEEINE